jgi:alkanesulfonate monooxygenase SsuD/methylene tetrahydromethanopterin reductase-like flavin-dependent oxidoreductase (luciferase family)
MKLGLSTGLLSGPSLLSEGLKWVKEAERLGFDSIWSSETYGSDALTPLAW